MSQLNLKQILSGDNLSIVVDKLNYNFNQLLLNGGGPQGLKGIMGSPGLPGSQGLQGLTGPIGSTGTHLYADGASPGDYPFGTGGEIQPRTGDVFIETDPTYLKVWELAPTGATGNYWREVELIQAPGNALSNLVFDASPGLGASATWTAASNDPLIAGKFLIGSTTALANGSVIDTLSPPGIPRFRTEFSSVSGMYGNTLVTLAASNNQLRILDSERSNDILTKNGGVIHSLETSAVGGSPSIYYIKNADTLGEKHLVVSLNTDTNRPTLLYADKTNRLGIGTAALTPLSTTLVVNGGFAVGSITTSFYLASAGATLDNGIGGIIEGNVAIGRNKNSFATLGVYNRPTEFGATLIVDTDITSASSSATSEIFLGGNMYAKELVSTVPSNYWRFRHTSHTSNLHYRKLTLYSQQAGLTGTGTGVASRNTLAIGLTASGSDVATQFHIDSLDLYDTFEVNSGVSTVSIGKQQGSAPHYMSSHIGMNLSRSPVLNEWRRNTDGTSNGGRAFWSSAFLGLGLTLMKSTGGTAVTGLTDDDIYNNTRVYFGIESTLGTTGTAYSNLVLSEKNSAARLETFAPAPGLIVDYGASGTTGSGAPYNSYRRFVAHFGDGLSTSTGSGFTVSKKGSPTIAPTNGINQSTATGVTGPGGSPVRFLPQYTWYGDDTSGLFLGNAGRDFNANGLTGQAVGLSVNGWPGLTIQGTDNYIQRVGIGNPDPYEFLHIGDKLVFNNRFSSLATNDSKFIGYNMYFDTAANQLKRIAGSTATGATQQGAFAINFTEKNKINPSTTLARYTNLGTSLYLNPYGVGGTSTGLTPAQGNSTYRGFIFSNPAVGPTASGWNNAAPRVPQLMIGLPEEETANTSTTARRGTISLAAQMRVKPASAAVPPTGPFGNTIEDQYNIGLYSYEGDPVSAIFGGGGLNGRNTVKTFGINFLGEGGNAIAGDIPFLYGTTDVNLTKSYQRTANFGTGFRLGVNIVPRFQNQIFALPSDPIHDFASLVVGGYSEGIVATSYENAIIAKGNIVIDQSVYSGGNGGNTSIWWKDNTIVTGTTTSRPGVDEYLGDWAVQYWKASANEAGLNFWKPFTGALGDGGNAILYLSDTSGSVGIGTTDFNFTTAYNGAGNASVMGPGYGSGQPASADDGSTDVWSAIAYVQSVPNAGVGIPGIIGIQPTKTWRAKLAVNGITKQTGLINISDNRFKNELARLRPGQGLERILKLEPVLYSWKGEHHPELEGKIELGLFAQEVKEIIPEAVSTYKSDRFEDEHTLEYNAVFTTMIAAIKDLNIIVEEKDQAIKNLEDKLSKIEELLAKNGIK